MQFDDLSHKSSGSSLNTNTNSANQTSPKLINSNPPLKRPNSFTIKSDENGPDSADNSPVPAARTSKTLPRVSSTPTANKNDNVLDEWEQKLYGRTGKNKLIILNICYI